MEKAKCFVTDKLKTTNSLLILWQQCVDGKTDLVQTIDKEDKTAAIIDTMAPDLPRQLDTTKVCMVVSICSIVNVINF